MPPITGDLGATGIPRLLRAVADEGRTGLLTVDSPGEEGDREALIYFRDGDVYHTRLRGSGIRLGSRLISAGFVSHEEVETALHVQQGEGRRRRLGEIILDAGYIEADQLATIVREQMEDIAFEVLKWDSGNFSFQEGAAAQEDTELEVSVENLIMEGARRFREWHTITRRIPTLEAVPRFADEGDAVEVVLTPDEWSLVSRVDASTTISELATQCGFTDLEAARCVFGMVSAGLLTVDLPPGVQLPSDEPGIEEMFDELEHALDEAARAPRDPSASVSLAELAGVDDQIEDHEEAIAEPAEPVEVEAEPAELEVEPVEAEADLGESEVEPVEAEAEVESEVKPAEAEAEPFAEEPVELEAEPEVLEAPPDAEGERSVLEETPEPYLEEPLSEEAVDTFHPLDEVIGAYDAAPPEATEADAAEEDETGYPETSTPSDEALREEVPLLEGDAGAVDEAAEPVDDTGEFDLEPGDLPGWEEMPEISEEDRHPSLRPGPTKVHEAVVEAVGRAVPDEDEHDPTPEREALEEPAAAKGEVSTVEAAEESLEIRAVAEELETYEEPLEEPLEEPALPPAPSPEAPPTEGPPAEVLAEETEEEPVQLTSVARMFADLANPVEESTVKLARGGDNGHDESDEPESEESDKHEDKKWSATEPRKVDPSVDVKSLIREFSSLDDE